MKLRTNSNRVTSMFDVFFWLNNIQPCNMYIFQLDYNITDETQTENNKIKNSSLEK